MTAARPSFYPASVEVWLDFPTHALGCDVEKDSNVFTQYRPFGTSEKIQQLLLFR
jgi:hypothetical protein